MWRFIKRLFLILILANILFVVLGIFFNPPITLTQLGGLIKYGKLQRDYISYDDMGSNIKKAVIASEDQTFFNHNGFDYKAIEKAILASDLGLTPNNDGKSIRLNLPALTEERRRELVKVVNARLEECRVAVRNIRREVIKSLRDLEKEKEISEDEEKQAEDELQELTDAMMEKIEQIGERKEKEILEI